MQEDRMKLLLKKAIMHELNSRKLTNYKEIISLIPEKDYMVFFDVLEAHYLANNMMDDYMAHMYWYVRSIMFLSYLIKSMTNGEIMANTICSIHPNRFSKIEKAAIAEELIERIDGKDFYRVFGFESINDKNKKLMKGKKFVVHCDKNNKLTLKDPV